ncbi:MAG: alpha/beta hydrolase [Corynebacterium sp.]|nr:alpha/beta hydrolase [Corynebacterium sp.]
MALRKRSSVVARSWLKRLRPSHRAELEKLYGGLHDPSTEPGLTQVSASGTVEHDGLDIAWYEVGREDAPVTVVFIHGYCLSAEAYYDQANYLRGRNARALLVDLRGHGQSSTSARALRPRR